MKKTFLTTLALIGASALSAHAMLMLTETALPAGTTSLFNAVGTFNFGNSKARLEAAGQTTVQGGNPGNGWWGDGSPTTAGTTPVRSWDVSWNNTTGVVTFNVYASADWTGATAMSMTQTPVFSSGNTLVGLGIGARLTSTAQSVTLDNIQFDGDGAGVGSWVDVDTAEATYSGNLFVSDYHGLLNGPLSDFVLRGTTIFPTGTTTGDSMRFFVDAQQGAGPIPSSVPDGGATLGLLGSALTGLAALRRKLGTA